MNKLKKNHSKLVYLNCQDIKPAEYLNCPQFNTKQKQLLFRLRSKTLDVKMNFRGQYKDLWCISCGLFPESQGHLIQCPQLVTKLNYLSGKTSKLNENDIYSNMEKQEVILKIYNDILEVRDNLNM